MPPTAKGTHPIALFSLVPTSNRARAAVDHPENSHLVSRITDDPDRPGDDQRGLNIGVFIGSKSRYTLATIGRCGDITVEGAGISRIQCSFEINEDNKTEIMLQDRSTNKSTQFFGTKAMPFELGRPHRRVLVDKHVNLEFGFGGVGCDLYRFRIVWHDRGKLMADFDYREDNPRQTRTVLDEPPTIEPSRRTTRVHTPGNPERIRYSYRDMIGSGAFGEVWKVANVDSGEWLAVKRVKRPHLQSYNHVLLKREVETLSRICHRNVIEYKSAVWADEHFEIFMAFRPGNVEDLIRRDLFIKKRTAADAFVHQMLQALDYLASESIIHRDIKPENILYSPMPDGGLLYQLADFGLANIVADARTFAGSRLYMAPELENSPDSPQTPKMDVWSLFVTLAYALNGAGFRQKPLHNTPLRIKAIQEAANEFRPLRDMAHVDPRERATAGDMLDRLFAGEGRTTRRNPIRAAAISPDEPGPSGERVEQERKRVRRVEQRPQRAQREIKCDSADVPDQCDWCRHHNLRCTFGRTRPRKGLKIHVTTVQDGPAGRRVSTQKSPFHETRPREPRTTSKHEAVDARSRQTAAPSHPHGTRTSEAALAMPLTSLDETPLRQIFFGGRNFGAIDSQNGIPHFTLQCHQWILSRTGQWPRFHDLDIHDPGYDENTTECSSAPVMSAPLNQNDKAVLPDQHILAFLLRTFMDSELSLIFPLVDSVLIEETARMAYAVNSHEYISARACMFAFLSMVGTRFPDIKAASEINSDACAAEAQLALSELLHHASITNLQTMIMLLLHEMLRGRVNTASMYHALACRTVFTLKGHTCIPPTHYNLTRKENENRHLRMLFWMCYVLDKDIALRTGQPPVIDDQFCNLTLPDNYMETVFVDGNRVTKGQRTPWFTGDLRLSLLKSKTTCDLYSHAALVKTDAELLKTIRVLDEELESWRISIPEELRPGLSVQKKANLDTMSSFQSMIHIELSLNYYFLLNTIHAASGRFKVNVDGHRSGRKCRFGVQSSLDLSAEASRSTLRYLSTVASRLYMETFWVFCFYPTSALMTLFFNILHDPHHDFAMDDVELLCGASNVLQSMPIRRVTPRETMYLKRMDILVRELSELSRLAIARQMTKVK
ncbi:Mitogen-activated protein kinase kinase kinase 2 [Metarhizium brunneum]|uniref:Mitogen-activated protein kinase kinase kinase 2 n=1 Tax=Metarhizium brunneum TaxID=500148 RepID=A0A7D5ZAN7_9HYPO|nr:Mitogen-activated protein kinase kinase kinase 2 [Metarhizium brunneum]